MLVALVDRLSGPNYSFSVFYLLVVVWVSAAGQKKRDLLVAADLLMYSAKREGRGSSRSTVPGKVFAGAQGVPPAPPPGAAAPERSA